MKTLTLLPLAVAAVIASCSLAGCRPSYNVDESTRLAALADSDSTLSQETYSKMITMLDKGYDYMRSRVAEAALERNPTAAINDVINIMGDSTLHAVESHSRKLMRTLDKAKLDEVNRHRYRKIKEKYIDMELSLASDSAAADSESAE